MAASVDKTSLSSASSAPSPHETPYLAPDRLTRLPSKVLDSIFSVLPTDRHAPHRGPICKSLLPAQRRLYKGIRLPNDVDVVHAKVILSQSDNLERLRLSVNPDLPDLLASLPQPAQLKSLAISSRYIPGHSSVAERPAAVFGHGVAPAVARFTVLSTRELDCPVDLSSSVLIDALRLTRLSRFTFDLCTSDTVQAGHLTPLVSGPTKLPFLQRLDLDFSYAEEGMAAEEALRLPKNWRFYETWTVPKWPEQFSREDLEALVKAAEVTVDGNAVDALEIEDMYKEEKATFKEGLKQQAEQRSRGRYGRQYWRCGGRSDGEEEEE